MIRIFLNENIWILKSESLQYKAIAWTDAEFSLGRFSGIHLRAI